MFQGDRVDREIGVLLKVRPSSAIRILEKRRHFNSNGTVLDLATSSESRGEKALNILSREELMTTGGEIYRNSSYLAVSRLANIGRRPGNT